MTISYNNGIPAANNNPSVDQPNLRTNTDAVDTILQRDHISFNTAFGGTHKQVTFASNNVPSVPTSPPVLFTNNVTLSGTLPQLFYYSGDATHGSSQYTVNNIVGSTFLFGGMILKWGTTNVAAGSTSNVFFPVPFPNNCYAVSASVSTTSQAPSNTENYTIQPFNFSIGGFQILKSNSTKILSISYVAIGN